MGHRDALHVHFIYFSQVCWYFILQLSCNEAISHTNKAFSITFTLTPFQMQSNTSQGFRWDQDIRALCIPLTPPCSRHFRYGQMTEDTDAL